MAALAAVFVAGGGVFAAPHIFSNAPALAQEAAPASLDRAAIEKIVRDYLIANPELLQEMAGALQKKEQIAAQTARAEVFKTSSSEIYDSKNQVVLGNPKGDVTLVEFFDYNCGYCKQALEDTQELLKSDPNLRLVLKEFPVLGQESADAARIAVAVNAQAPDKYLDFHTRLLGAELADGDTALKIAASLGIDREKLAKAAASQQTEQSLIAVHALARQLDITGTPTYIIGDEVLPGRAGAANIKPLIANMRKCGKIQCEG